MQDEFNPYAAPSTSTMHPRAAEWLRATDDPSLLKVASGLRLMYIGIITIVLAILFGILLALVMGAMSGGEGALTVVVLAVLAAVAGVVMMIVGKLMCLATPEETGAKGLIGASVILDVIGFGLTVITLFIENQALNTIGSLVSIAAQVTFLLFLKGLSEFIGAVPLAERAKLLLTLLAVTLGIQVVALIAAFVAPALTVLLGLALLVIGLASFFMYLGLLNQLSEALKSGGAVESSTANAARVPATSFAPPPWTSERKDR